MKVMMLLHDFLPYPSGAGGFVMTWALARSLMDNGHEVVVCRFGASDDSRFPWLPKARTLMRETGMRVVEVPAAGQGVQLTRATRVRRAMSPRMEDYYRPLADLGAMAKVLEAERPDVLYLYTMKAVALAEALDTQIPRVASIIDLDFDLLAARRKYLNQGSRLGWLYSQLDKLSERDIPEYLVRLLKTCELVIDHAAHHAAWVQEQGIRCVYLPNPVQDPLEQGIAIKDRQNANPERLKISLIGSISGVSTAAGLDYLAKELLPAVPMDAAVEFHIIGQGKPPGGVLELLQRDSRVKIRGFVDDIGAEFNSTDILLVPTPISLGFRTRIAQGFGYGSVVVAHEANSAGMPELVNQENCLLCTEPGQFWEAAKRLQKDATLYRTLHLNARGTFEKHYSSKIVCTRMTELLQEVANRSPAEMNS